MKNIEKPLSTRRSPKMKQKSSGKTSSKPRAITKFSRQDREIPGDRGAYEKESTVQGSE